MTTRKKWSERKIYLFPSRQSHSEFVAEVVKNKQGDPDEAWNEGSQPSVAFACQGPADGSHVVIVAVGIDKAELSGEVTGHQNLSGLGHDPGICCEVNDSLTRKLDRLAQFEHLGSGG